MRRSKIPALSTGNRLPQVFAKGGRRGREVQDDAIDPMPLDKGTLEMRHHGHAISSASPRYREPGMSVYSRSIASKGSNLERTLGDQGME
jgi:hypothetical protein